MNFIKNHKYLIFLIIFNIALVWTFLYHESRPPYIFTSNWWILLMILPWRVVLPMDAFYLSRRYPSKKKLISIISTVVVYLSFLIILDPGTPYYLGEEVNTWLYRFVRIRSILEVFPYFLIVINISYIALIDLWLRYLANKLYKK